MKRLLLLSGKGGTGKTTVAAAFTHLAQAKAVADCDVDAPNLHLVLQQTAQPQTKDFFGGDKAVIDTAQCASCGLCAQHCRFDAIFPQAGTYAVRDIACEGCGVCAHICPQGAISLQSDLAGEQQLYAASQVFSTARLKMGRGNSGKLVTNVKLTLLKEAPPCDLAIFDGSPGIGCPVIASVSGMDLVLVVAEPSESGLSDLKRLVSTAQTLETTLAVCVNKWDVSPRHTAAIEDFCAAEHIPFLGKIPYDSSASLAINSGQSIAQLDCPAGAAIRLIFGRVQELLIPN